MSDAGGQHGVALQVVGAVGRLLIRAVCGAIVLTRLDARVVGRENLPRHGAVLIAARHYHHLYDGCLLIARSPRPPAILVALDWIGSRPVARALELLCALARWPVVLRPEAIRVHGQSAYRADEARRYLARATRDSTALLREGGVLLLFPEGYPNADPGYTPKRGEEFLSFRAGFLRLAALAERRGTRVAIVPVGIAYGAGGWRRRAVLRFGPPRYLSPGSDRAALAGAIEADVRTLSAPPSVP